MESVIKLENFYFAYNKKCPRGTLLHRNYIPLNNS